MVEKYFFSLLLVCGLISLFPYQSEALYEPCTTDDNCTDPSAFCDGGTCVCNLTTHYILNEGSSNEACEAKHSLGASCPATQTETCLNTNAICDAQDSICKCKNGFTNSGGQCVQACGNLTDPDNGVVEITNNTEGGIATYTCNEGFVINGENSITERQCSNGAWSNAVPTCSQIDCGAVVDTVTNGIATAVNDTTLNSTVTVVCDSGYEIDTNTITCQANGNWSSANCTIKDCGSTVNFVTNGIAIEDNNTTVNSTATVECFIGYEIDTNTVTCQPNGNWSSANCTIKDCGSIINTVTNGIATGVSETIVNSTATVECYSGYERDTNTVICQANGNWSSANCTIKDCGPTINTLTNGVATEVSETTVNSTATVECFSGYEIDTNTIICQPNGNWSSANCIIKDCGSIINTVTNGIATGVSETIVNSTATVECYSGYERDTNTVICQANGNWSSANCTLKDCGPSINTVTNGVATEVSETTVNSTATVECFSGYEIDTNTITCQANGNWSFANCIIKDCGSLDTVINGIATEVSETTVNSTAIVECNSGYEIDTNTLTCQSNGNWSSANCTIKDCGSPANSVLNGKATVVSETTVNSTATVQCNSGYETETNAVVCQANGNWSSLTCNIKDCGMNVNTVTNGIATVVNETTVNSTATVVCDSGFEIETNKVTCQPNGYWSAAICTIKDCGSTVNSVTNGIATVVSVTTVNSTATVECDSGFETLTNTVTCQTNGNWSSANCTIKDCGASINTVTNGNATVGSETTVNSTATVECDTGYEIGINTIICQANGKWSSATCTITDCGESITTISNGSATVTPGKTVYGSTASVSCNQGFETNTSTITCTANGTWSTAVCTEQICPTLSNKPLFTVSVTSSTEGGTATYTCITGYTVGDSSVTTSTRTCTNGAWTGQEPNCTPVDCGTLSDPNNGRVVVSPNTQYQATATYSCNEGYIITSGDSRRTCTAGGTWSGSEPTCSKRDCGSRSNPENGLVNVSPDNKFGATATYSCNSGYDLSGSQTLTCTSSGTWSGSPPTCTRRDCGTLVQLTNGGISYNTDTRYLSTATYTCNTGYIITGTTSSTYSRTCRENGWDGSDKTCSKRDCGTLVQLTNGGISYNTDTRYLSTATYTCNTGYIITGTTSSTYSRTCRENGWDGSDKTCSKRDCGDLLNPDNGQVNVFDSLYLGTAQYICNTGYDVTGRTSNTLNVFCTEFGTWSSTGVNCSIRADPLGATCPNPSLTNLSPGDLCIGDNASCQRRSSTSQDFTCQCNTGYYDDNGNQPAGQCRTISELEVSSITFTSVTTTEMIVSWTPPTNRVNFISGYSVEWRPKDNSDAGSSSQNLITTSSYTISNNVVSGKAYTVKVISQNKVDYRETVKTTFNQKEQALKPQRPGPINTASSNLDARDQTIDLVWAASSGHVWYYTVELFDVGGQTALKTVTSSNSNVNLSYGQMKNGHRYDVSITAFSQMFDGSKRLTSDKRREEIKTIVQVPSVPRSVQCQMVTDSLITIKWQASTNPNGDLVGYKIDTYLLGSSDTLKTENKTENIADVSQTFEVGGLSPGSNYYFNVFTINEGYISSAARLTNNSCETRASMAGPPNNLVISRVQSRNFSVSWTRPTNTSGEHRGYVIQVRLQNDTCVKQLVIKCTGCSGTFDESSLENMCLPSISTTEQLDTAIISSTASISRQITELDPDTNYNVIITAVNAEGRGNTADQNQRTEEEIPQKPKNVTISNLSPTSCTVTWDIDGPRPGNTTYTVNVVAVLPVTPNNHLLLGFNNRTQALTGLQEYWNYTVKIRAETSKGNVESDPKTFITLPAAPGDVDTFNVVLHPDGNYKRLAVKWKIPVLLERNSIIDRFELQHNTSEDMNMRMIQFTKNDEESFVYTKTFNVTPEEYYQFKVFAINTDNQNGSVTEKVVMAPPGVPTNVFEIVEGRAVINESLVAPKETSLTLIYDNVGYFNQDNAGAIVSSGVILCAASKCTGNEIGVSLTKEQFENYPNWHTAQPEGFTKYRCTRTDWRQQNQSGRKRRQTGMTEEFTIGAESCNETTRNQFCNGPLNPGTSYIVHVVICTNGGCLISNKYGPFATQTVPDDGGNNIVIIVVAVIVPLVVIIAAIVVVMVILRRRTGNKMSRMEPSKIESNLEDPATARIEKHRPIKLSEFEEYLARLHKDSNLLFSAEYEDLRTVAPSHPQEAANREENRLKNRYINILPFDHSRVKLFSNGEDDSSDYINGNYLPGYRSPREYIGCQGPIPGTIDDFWRMVWEQKVSIVVMLTLCKEGQKVKCEQYWPDEQGEPKQYGDVVVEMTSNSTIQTYIIRMFKITNAGQTRTIKHFHFLSWLDFQANVKHDIILDFITHVRSHVQPPDTVGPMIVHCSAGVGRTGTYICLDHLMQFIEDHDFDVNIDIFDMVLRLRDNRPLMVQTEQQYVFIHDCVKELMDRKRKQMDNIYENQGFAGDENIYQNTEPQLYENVQMKTSF